jgi:CheY-like chemotaxis protein
MYHCAVSVRVDENGFPPPGLAAYCAAAPLRREFYGLDGCGAGTVPIIAMTANVFKEDVESVLAAGMNGHLGKPVIVEDVMRTLEKYL